MPKVDTSLLKLGAHYSRASLADLWGYAGVQALARGVVTPAGERTILLFVTHEKQGGYEPYDDRLEGAELFWEGPTDHFAEARMLRAAETGDKIHLFYRQRHHTEFCYHGELALKSCDLQSDAPSKFVFTVEKPGVTG
jgi:hypothetical protein